MTPAQFAEYRARRRGDGLRIGLRRPARPVELPGRRAAPGRARRVPRCRALNRACGRTIGAGADGVSHPHLGQRGAAAACLPARRARPRPPVRAPGADASRPDARDRLRHARPWPLTVVGRPVAGSARRRRRRGAGVPAESSRRRLLGDSFGARVAIEFAAAHGDRVTALVLLDPPLLPTYPTPEELEAQRRSGAFVSVDDAVERLRAEAGLVHTPRALLEEEMAEHLVADEDGRFRLRYSRQAVARAADGLVFSPPRLKEIVLPDADRACRGVEGARRAGRRAGGRRSCAAARSRSSREATPCCGTRWPRPARSSATSSPSGSGHEHAPASAARRRGRRRTSRA